ncbi:MAG TPA: response regulator [Spirochaetia bacterium]|nr:response regulator [Spirochaetia bacterium]
MTAEGCHRSQRQTIMVVDDVPENIALLSATLENSYRIKAVRDGETAIRIACSDDPPDLILLDVMMPKMNGYEVCRQLKANESTASIPVIFVTARSEEADESTGFEIGAVDYISKPINPAIVRARVRTHLELSRMRNDLVEKNRQLEKDAVLREEVEAINRHDLKNPLLVVMNVPKLLRGTGNLTEKQEKLLGMVEGAGVRMLEIVDSTVNLYKMENGTYELTPTQIDLLQVLHSIEAMVAAIRLGKEVSVAITVDGRPAAAEEMLLVRGEELLLYSLFSNLMKNAAEAAYESETVQVSVRTGDPVVVEIHNKLPVPERIREVFFEKFSTAGKRQGTGLGTYTARLITGVLGGAISLNCSTETGTTVRIALPASGISE